MEIKAIHKNARLTPRKARRYRELIRGLSVADAKTQLAFLPGKAPKMIGAVLRSAIANATNNFSLNENALRVADVQVNQGFVLTRYQPMSKGMAYPVKTRTAHVTVVVEDIPGVAGAAPVRRGRRVKDDQGPVEAEHTHTDATKEVSGRQRREKSLPPAQATEVHKDKSMTEVTPKMRMLQQGGDQKKSRRGNRKKTN